MSGIEFSNEESRLKATRWLVEQMDNAFYLEARQERVYIEDGELDQPTTVRISGELPADDYPIHPVEVHLDSCINNGVLTRRFKIIDTYRGGVILENYLATDNKIIDTLAEQQDETVPTHLSYWLFRTFGRAPTHIIGLDSTDW
jgi:hypothetical protein